MDPRPPFPCHGIGCGGAGRKLGHIGLAVAVAACSGHVFRLGHSDKVPSPNDGGQPERSPGGGGRSPSGMASRGRSCRATLKKA